MRTLWLVITAMLMLMTPVMGQEPATDPYEKIDPDDYTCREHLNLVELNDGRYEVRTVWAHGYYTGMRNPKLAKDVTQETLDSFEKRVEKICKAGLDRLFLAAVREVK